MIAPGSLVGFGVVLVLLAWTFSALATLVVRLSHARLRAAGPAAERRAAELAAGLPVVLAASVTAALVIESAVGHDHCTVHSHHAHLCLYHGGVWLAEPWAVAFLAGAVIAGAARLVVTLGRQLRTHVHVRQLRRVAVPAGDVHLADSARAFCFVAGVARPRIYASTAAWQALTPQQRAAVVAHERAHVDQRDLRRRLVLDLLLAFAAPLAASTLRSTWSAAAERLCDVHAARATGRPDLVAEAMVRFCRLQTAPVHAAGFPPRANDLADRVRAVLAEGPDGEAAGRRLGRVAFASLAVVLAVAVAFAEPIHHALETLLG